jgi:hypothetical protein
MSSTSTLHSVPLPALSSLLSKAPKLAGGNVPASPANNTQVPLEKSESRTTFDYKVPDENTKNYSVMLNKKEDLQIVEIPIPKPAKGEVQLQVKATGICGSDVHTWKHGAIGIFEVTDPIILGHESMGIVTEVGEGVTNLQIGDRVAIEA